MEPKKIDKKTEKNIYEKLQEARVALQNKAIKKSGFNKFANYKYFEQGDFLPEATNIFLEYHLTPVFNLRDDMATLEIINSDKPEETIHFEISTEKIPSDFALKGCTAVQTLGGMNTYLKRYLYLNALDISENDPIDATTQEVAPKALQETATKETAEEKKETGNREMTLEQSKKWLLSFLEKGAIDSRKAFGTAKHIQENTSIPHEEKLKLLEAIDYVYKTKYKEEFEKKSFLV